MAKVLDNLSSSTTHSHKRASSAAGITHGSNARSVKRRASKACQTCRQRKVRCNVVEHGAPCTNCRLDEVDCVVTESKRRKRLLEPIDDAAPRIPQILLAEARINIEEREQALHDFSDGFSPLSPSGLSFGSSSSDRESDHNVPPLIYHHQGGKTNEEERQHQSSMNAPFDIPFIHSQPTLCSQNPLSLPQINLPGFIRPLHLRVDNDDMNYLHRKGALSLPGVTLRNALVRSYIDYVHGFMPLLNIHEFLAAIEGEDGSRGQVSLVLFHAVMFAAVAFVDIEYLTAAGYSSRKAARKAFFHKARLTYDIGYEVDRIALVQALLLMTFWYESPDEQKDTWHWMGLAISLAYTIGLNRDPTKTDMERRKQALYKRIWWCCFMRDRLIAIGMRRPTRIKTEDYDVPMLVLDDFDLQAIDDGITSIGPGCALARDVKMQQDIATLCIFKAQLCVCICHVLSAQYSILAKSEGPPMPEEVMAPSNAMLLPRVAGNQEAALAECDAELRSWYSSLPGWAAFYPELENTALDRHAEPLVVHKAMVHLIYYTTLSALHRPRVLPGPKIRPTKRNERLHELSLNVLLHAAAAITSIARYLVARNIVRFLPPTAVTTLLPALMIHLLDLNASNEEVRNRSRVGYQICMNMMQELRKCYAAAGYATIFMEVVVSKCKAHSIPCIRNIRSSDDIHNAQLNGPTPLTDHLFSDWAWHSPNVPLSLPNPTITPPQDFEKYTPGRNNEQDSIPGSDMDVQTPTSQFQYGKALNAITMETDLDGDLWNMINVGEAPGEEMIDLHTLGPAKELSWPEESEKPMGTAVTWMLE